MTENPKTAPPRPWSIIETALWALLPTLISIVALLVAALVTGSRDFMRIGLVGVVWTVMQVEVLAWVVRRRGWHAGDYLGWIAPKPRDTAVMLAIFVAFILAFEALNYLLDIDVSPRMIDTYRTAREAGGLVMLWIAIVVAAPLGEEIVFRGFLYRGWARSPRAVVPAVVVISALWAICHVQYDWFAILEIFLFGLVLGWARWRSGSTMVTFAMHALNNMLSMVETHWLA